MSINDLLNNGIEIQGAVIIIRWINDEEHLIFSSYDDVVWNQNLEWMNHDIKYMYAISGIGYVALKIEIE